jgi:molecular chaperone GrpE (heat shock protein)
MGDSISILRRWAAAKMKRDESTLGDAEIIEFIDSKLPSLDQLNEAISRQDDYSDKMRAQINKGIKKMRSQLERFKLGE